LIVRKAIECQAEISTGFNEIGISFVLRIVEDVIVICEIAAIDCEMILIAIGNDESRIGPITIVYIIRKAASHESDIEDGLTIFRVEIIKVKGSIGIGNFLPFAIHKGNTPTLDGPYGISIRPRKRKALHHDILNIQLIADS